MKRALLIVAAFLIGAVVTMALYVELRSVSLTPMDQTTESVQASESDVTAAAAEASLYRLPNSIDPTSLSCNETRFEIRAGGHQQGLIYRWCIENSTNNVSAMALSSIATENVTPKDQIASDHCVGVLKGDGTPLSISQRCTATIPFENCVVGVICNSEVAVVITDLSSDGTASVSVTVP